MTESQVIVSLAGALVVSVGALGTSLRNVSNMKKHGGHDKCGDVERNSKKIDEMSTNYTAVKVDVATIKERQKSDSQALKRIENDLGQVTGFIMKSGTNQPMNVGPQPPNPTAS